MVSSETETSSAGEQLARDKLDERQKTKTQRETNLFVFFRVLYAKKNSHQVLKIIELKLGNKHSSLRVFLYEVISLIVLFEIAYCLAMTNVVLNNKTSNYFKL